MKRPQVCKILRPAVLWYLLLFREGFHGGRAELISYRTAVQPTLHTCAPG